MLVPRCWGTLSFGLSRRIVVCAYLLLALGASESVTMGAPPIQLNTPLAPPTWALLELELLRSNTAACQAFYAKYFDERGYLQCVERWGGDDGPDDAIENCSDWPILHALGADDVILHLYKRAWEGHLKQYTQAKTKDVPFARDGMYYREFPVMMDWLHNGEGLTVFNLQGLSDPQDPAFQQRVRRFAGFYLNEDPQAANYDPQHKIIRSLLNGSRGPLLRKATALDWAGDPIEVAGRFRLAHGESSYEEMLAHFQDYHDVMGDHPSNLLATSLGVNAYMLAHEEKYRRWVLEYVDAWRHRMADNDGIIPSNIGLDGTIGGAAEGRWWGGVYGWGFSVIDPHTGEMAHRSTFQTGFQGFMNAMLLTGDTTYLAPWREMRTRVNSQAKVVNGQTLYPSKFGADGWYAYTPTPFAPYADELHYLSQSSEDRRWVTNSAWLQFLTEQTPSYPEQILRADLAQIRVCLEGMRSDPTTPDTRLSDDPMKFAPCRVGSLIELMLGGIHPGHRGGPLFAGVRYFDPVGQRAGLPPHVAALVDQLSNSQIAVTLVNLDLNTSRTITVQGGAYGEHQLLVAHYAGQDVPIHASHCTVTLAPGCGGKIVWDWQRFANPPKLAFPE